MKRNNLTTDGNARISALQRLTKPNSSNNSVHQRLSVGNPSTITDARELLSNRSKPVFDARQLLSRQTSTKKETPLIIRRDREPEEDTPVNTRLAAGGLARLMDKKKNPFVSTEPISFTKTISNPTVTRPSSSTSLPDQKLVISFSNDQYRKRARSPSPTPPPVVKRMTNPTSISRLTIRRDSDEPPRKQASLSTKKRSKPTTILITNLRSSVIEDDIMEIFGQLGPINEIKTLSHGCVQVVYANEEHAHQAVADYHNRLLDGQSMYVSLQQATTELKSTKSTSSSTSSKGDASSKKFSIDPSFLRQALFNSSSTSDNSVQFQVKL